MPPNPQNLKPCKPGETHNPNGRPKGAKGIKATIKKYLKYELAHKNPLTKKDEKLSAEDHIILTAIAKAISGDDRAREDVLNRLYGKPVEHTKNTNTNMNVEATQDTIRKIKESILKDDND